MTASRRGWLSRPLDVAALLYFAAFYTWLALARPGEAWTVLLGNVLFVPAGLLVGGVALRNAAREIDLRTRLAWNAIAAGAFALWLTGAVYSFFDPTLAGTLFKWWTSLLYFPLVAAGLLLFPRAPLAAADRPRYLLDLALTIVTGLVLVFFIELVASVHAAQEDLTSRVAGALVEWVAFVASADAYLRAVTPMQRRVFGAWLAAAVAYMIGNVAFGLVHYQGGHWVDGVWFSAWVFRWIGVRAPADLDPGAFMPRAAANARVAYQHSVIPYAFLAAGFVLLVVAENSGHGVAPMALGAGTMTALLVGRHLLELRENRRLLAAQIEQQARFRSLVQQSSDVIVVLGADGRATYVSPAVARVFGADTALVEGADVAASFSVEGEGTLADVLAQPRLPERVAATLRTRGGVRDVEILTSDLRDDPAVQGLVLTCRDVTERNQLERQLYHAQKLDAIGQLAGGLAHEFNNLLAVIRGCAEGLAEELRGTPPGADHVRHIDQCVDRGAALTRKVLAFSRRQSVQPSVLDLDALVSEAYPVLRQLVPKDVEVVVRPDAGGWHIKADQGEVEQVILNLVANARDAMPGGGRIELRTRRIVETRDGEPHGFVALDVVDQGTGMSPDVRARIFEPFYTTKPREHGTGLGLAMVHGIVTKAGGRVEVQSEPGHGSTFTVSWRRTAEVVAAAAEAPAEPVLAGGQRRVLLVDDEPGVRVYVGRVLKQRGFRVEAVPGAAEALAIAADTARPIDLLLTDLIMPGVSGRELAARVRAVRPGLPVVYMTGFAEEGLNPRTDDPSMALLIKPFRTDALLRVLARALRDAPEAASPTALA